MSYDNAELERLSAFLDGSLSPDEARAVQERLDTSDDYRELHKQLASAREVLRSTSAPAPPAGLLAQIKSDAATEMARGAGASIWERWWAPVGAFAAAAAVLLAIFAPWQAAHRDDVSAVDPPTEPHAIVAESAADATTSEDATAGDEADAVEVAEAAVDEGAVDDAVPSEAPDDAVTRPAGPTHVARAGASPAPTVVEPEPEPAVQPEEPASEEPLLAAAPPSAAPSPATAGPVLSEFDGTQSIARRPRTTIEDGPSPDAHVPSALESEMVAGVVAGMVLDQFVARNMVESSATMLSVVTDTPTSELGPAIAGDEDETGSFGFSFTEAMRRALTESENELP